MTEGIKAGTGGENISKYIAAANSSIADDETTPEPVRNIRFPLAERKRAGEGVAITAAMIAQVADELKWQDEAPADPGDTAGGDQTSTS